MYFRGKSANTGVWSAGKEVLAKKMETSVMGYIGTTIRIDPSFLANQIPEFPSLGTIQRLCLCLHAQKLQLNTYASSKHLAEGRGNNEQRWRQEHNHHNPSARAPESKSAKHYGNMSSLPSTGIAVTERTSIWTSKACRSIVL